MKIGIFTNAYKPMISGVVNSIELIRKGLKKLGHNVYIFAPRFQDYKDKEIGIFRFMSVNLTSMIQYPLAIPYSPRISSIIDRVNLDIVHSHHPFLLGELGANVAEKHDIPLVFTWHTQYEQYSHYVPLPQNLVKTLTRASVTKYVEKCDQVICPSPTILAEINKYGFETPVQLLPNAIDLNQFKNVSPKSVQEKYGIKKDEKLLLYVGRLGQEKNLMFMLQAFKNAVEEAPDTKLMIVGQGSELENLRYSAKQMGLADKVILPGPVEYSEIPAYYAAGYAFVMTSTTEVKPLALLEAMASGLPVVAVAAAGSSDTVNDGYDGILTGLDRDRYSEALIRILKNKELRDSYSDNASKTAEQYSIEATSKKLERLYIDLANKDRTRKKVFTGALLKEGKIQVYTGDGKGKTTAALGLALRASGANMKVLIIQFMKGNTEYSEIEAITHIPNIDMIQFGTEDFVFKGKEKKIDYLEAEEGLKRAYKAYGDLDLSLLILDEINCAMDFNLLKVDDVLEFLDKKPSNLEVILTGRNAPEKIIERADLVTRMEEVKHYYNTVKQEARKGIEY
ncbi:MAG: cob(I)yrinic acid a,c-diamide adenosyltransferase [Vulcanimicrobiota bacterium]